MESTQKQSRQWVQGVLTAAEPTEVRIRPISQGWGRLQRAKSINSEPLNIHGRPFAWGLGTHADSEIVLQGPPMERIQGFAGADENSATRGATVLPRFEFWIEADGRELWRSQVLTSKDPAAAFDVSLGGAKKAVLKCRAVDGNLNWAHADWAEPVVVLVGGRKVKLGEPDAPHLLEPEIPLSFVYGGQPSATLLPAWQSTHHSSTLPDGVTLHALSWHDPATGLECVLELKEFPGFSAVEWVAHFRNTGKSPTPILENILPLDLAGAVDGQLILHRSRGSFFSKDDFATSQDLLTPGQPIVMTPVEGRSSTRWLPFFNLIQQSPSVPGLDFRVPKDAPPQTTRGAVIAIGWTGCWSSRSELSTGGALHVQAGLEKTHLSLNPGESIRTPSILLLNWDGKPIDGNNALRQFILKHHSPRPDGKPVVPPICNLTWGGMKSSAHLDRIKLIARERLPYDYYWVDAGWYGPADSYSPDEHKGDWFKHVGNWSVNPVAHPNGLRPLADAIHQAGMKFLLWVEPERAIWGTPVTKEHPEWFIGPRTEGASVLLNLGLPEARAWLTQFMSRLITENAVDCYRQDFNIDPLPLWRAADAPDRVGMTETLYIQGLYAFWDSLLADHPGLLIDNCASGGRRLDLEMISRSISLWRSDVQCFADYDIECSQSQTLGLNIWVPLNSCGTQVGPGDTYRFRSCLSAGINVTLYAYEYQPIDPAYPYDWHRRMMADFQRARPLFTGNFYPLTPFQQNKEAWGGFQCHRPDSGQGMVVAFRREKCPYSAASLPLNELDPAGRYELEDADTGTRTTEIGQKLLEDGLSLTMDKPRSSKLVFYRKL